MSYETQETPNFWESAVWVSTTQAKALLEAKADPNNRGQARQFNNDGQL